jgi:hypothetical protein
MKVRGWYGVFRIYFYRVSEQRRAFVKSVMNRPVPEKVRNLLTI